MAAAATITTHSATSDTIHADRVWNSKLRVTIVSCATNSHAVRYDSGSICRSYRTHMAAGSITIFATKQLCRKSTSGSERISAKHECTCDDATSRRRAGTINSRRSAESSNAIRPTVYAAKRTTGRAGSESDHAIRATGFSGQSKRAAWSAAAYSWSDGRPGIADVQSSAAATAAAMIRKRGQWHHCFVRKIARIDP